MAYSKIERHIWHDETFRRLSPDARLVFLYLLSSPHSNRIGMYVLDHLYAASDLELEPEQVQSALAELEEHGRINYDPGNRLVLILRHLKHNTLENPNVVKAAQHDLSVLPFSQPLWEQFAEAVNRWGKGFWKPLREQLANRLRNGMANPEPEPEPEPEPIGDADASLSDESDDCPCQAMHGAFVEVLGNDPPHPRLTDTRRQKYRALWDEHLSRLDEWEAVWRSLLLAVTESDHHMSDRTYQMPDSFLRNADRRDRWIQKAAERMNGRHQLTAGDRKILRYRHNIDDVELNA